MTLIIEDGVLKESTTMPNDLLPVKAISSNLLQKPYLEKAIAKKLLKTIALQIAKQATGITIH